MVMEVEMSNRLLTFSEMKDILRCSKSTLYKYVNQDDFPSFKIGREHRILEDDLMDWIKNKANKKGNNPSMSEQEKPKNDNHNIEIIADDKYMTLIEAARILRISEAKMTKLYKVKGFPYIKQGNRILIPIREFNEWTNSMVGKTIELD